MAAGGPRTISSAVVHSATGGGSKGVLASLPASGRCGHITQVAPKPLERPHGCIFINKAPASSTKGPQPAVARMSSYAYDVSNVAANIFQAYPAYPVLGA